MRKKAIGIDLGTTNSCISYYRTAEGASKGAPIIVPLNGKQTIQSCVMLKNGELIVGEEAYENRHKPSVIYSVKRLMGTDNRVSLIDEATGEKRTYSPKEISATILKHIKEVSERTLGSYDEVTITVPAYFTPAQKRDTKEAGKLAGFETIHIINEPTSASLAYQIDAKEPEKVIVFDLGGGTFDVSVVQITPVDNEDTKEGSEDFLESFYGISTDDSPSGAVVKVIESDGDNKLGGDDVDKYILRRLLFTETRNQEINITDEEVEFILLRIEKYKKLGIGGTIQVNPSTTLHMSLDHIRFGYTKVLTKCMNIVNPLIDKYKEDVSRIILVGGSTKSPLVSRYLNEMYPDLEVYSDLNPDESIALGASVNSAIQTGDLTSLTFFDVLPTSISVEDADGRLIPILRKNAIIPTEGKEYMEIVTGSSAVIKVHIGEGYAESETYIGYIELTPEDTKELIALEFQVDLDSILHIKVSSSNKSAYKRLINVSSMDDRGKKKMSRTDRVHRRRISNIQSIYSEAIKSTSLNYSKETLEEINSLLEEYRETSDKDKFYAEHKRTFSKFTSKYEKHLTEFADKRINQSIGAFNMEVQEATEEDGSPHPNNVVEFPTSSRFTDN